MARSIPDPAEPDRLAALHRYDILGTPRERAFDRIAELAAHLLEAPMAGIHLIDDSCQWAKAQVGLDAPTLDLDVAFCVHGLDHSDVMVVKDATQDERFADNPLVTGDPGIRFYAGAPLITPDGFVLGSLCVIDTAPRPEGFGAPERETLTQLAKVVMDELEYRAQPRHREQVLESITDAFVAVDSAWHLTYLNQRAEELIGQPRDELLGMGAWDALPQLRGHALHTELDEALQDQESTQFETYLAPLERWFQVTAYPFEGGLSIYFDDVTAVHERRAQLDAERERVSMALTGADLGMWDLNLNTGRCLFDERWAEMLGYTLDEVDSTLDFFERHTHPDDLQVLYHQLDRHAQGEIPYVDAEIRMRHKNGSWRWVLDRGKILEWNEDGSPRRVVGTHMDITMRKEREEALRRERDLLQSIFDASPVAIVTLNADGQFVTASERAREILGLAPDAVLERAFNDPLWRITDPDGHPIPDEDLPFYRVMATGQRLSDIEHTIEWPDGTRRLLSVSGAPLSSPEGAPEGAVFILIDITERRQHEQELMAAKERAEAMNRLKNAFLANMSHELRTPLTSIIGFADVLSSQLDDSEGELIQLIRQSGKRLEETLTSILDLAELESEAIRLDPHMVDLAETVRSAVDRHRPTAHEKGLDVSLDVPDAPVNTVLDARTMQRIVSHLVSNAVKFTEEGGVSIRLRCTDSSFLLRVEDTGIGIDPAHVDRIFSEFEQESDGYTRNFEGIGVGLAITQRLVKLLGGTITVESEKGAGSVFTVQLPLHEPHDDAPSEGSRPTGSPAAPPTPTTCQPPTQPPTHPRPPRRTGKTSTASLLPCCSWTTMR